jgi:hypothetical protein
VSQPLSDTELDELRADYGKPWSTTSWNGLRWQKALATIDALRTQLAVQRKVVAAAETIIANADGHPDMCCGQCSSAVAAAEAREAKLRAALQTCADIGEMRVAAVVRAALAPESLEVQG